MHFDYKYERKAQEGLEVEDIGNVCLQAFSDFGETWVLIIRTVDGWTEAIQYGPVNVDVEEIPEESIYSYNRFQFNQKKLYKLTEKFVNQKDVSQVFVKDFNEVREVIRSYVDCLRIRDNPDEDINPINDDDDLDMDRFI